MRIDPDGHVPIYLQIADGIRAALAAGVYRPGDVLPSLRKMATDIHVHPNTVQRAYDELDREGLIYSQRGKGLFVTEQAVAYAQSRTGDGVRRAFDEAIRAGQTAGMTAAQMRGIFRAALEGIAPDVGVERRSSNPTDSRTGVSPVQSETANPDRRDAGPTDSDAGPTDSDAGPTVPRGSFS
jgi:GntR family transcriptional regulator